MSAHPPSWEQVPGSPGFYADAETGTLHIDLKEAVRGAGWLPTPENMAALERAARGIADRLGAELEVVEEP